MKKKMHYYINNLGEKKYKRNDGITLIALIITIIVLLVLASIGIATLNGENGIVTNAITAKEETRRAAVQEARDLWKTSQEIDNYTDKGTAQTFEELVNDLEKQQLITKEERTTLERTGQVKIGSKTIVFREAQPTIGEFIQYDVSYTDVYYPDYNYTNTNGWRLLSYTDKGKGIYSNVKLISTGIPARLYYHYNDLTYNTWFVQNEVQLNNFKTLLGSDYQFYEEDNLKYALKASAGMYYNFGDIIFRYGTSSTNTNQGYFTSITNGNKVYNNQNTTDTNANTLFKTKNANNVRLFTLSEINQAMGRNDVDSLVGISADEDSKGIYRLDQLKNVLGMSTYTYEDLSYLWIASPTPGERDKVSIIRNDGSMDGSSISSNGTNPGGVRPIICFDSDISFRLSEDGMYFIME